MVLLFYLLALVAALIKCRTVWRALPLFTLSVLTTIIFEFSYQPYSAAWLKAWYAWLIWPVFVSRALAVGESAYIHSEFLPKRWTAHITAFAFGLIGAGLTAWNMQSNVVPAGQWRRVAMIGMTAFLAAYVVLLWRAKQWRHGIAGRHVLFLLAICLSFTVPILLNFTKQTKDFWEAVDCFAYGSRALVLFTWCLSIPTRKDGLPG